MSKKKVFVLKESFNFKPGQILLGNEEENGILIENKKIYKEDYVLLKESLSKSDEERVRELCREILVKMFYRLYTQSPIMIK